MEKFNSNLFFSSTNSLIINQIKEKNMYVADMSIESNMEKKPVGFGVNYYLWNMSRFVLITAVLFYSWRHLNTYSIIYYKKQNKTKQKNKKQKTNKQTNKQNKTKRYNVNQKR